MIRTGAIMNSKSHSGSVRMKKWLLRATDVINCNVGKSLGWWSIDFKIVVTLHSYCLRSGSPNAVSCDCECRIRRKCRRWYSIHYDKYSLLNRTTLFAFRQSMTMRT